MPWHVFWAAATVLSSLGALRNVAMVTALFGSEYYSERAMRLLRRPPIQGTGKSRAEPPEPFPAMNSTVNGAQHVR